MAGWGVKGDVLIACNCDWGCPCNFNAPPSQGHCQGGWIWMIRAGHVADVPVDGLGIALFAKWPGAIHEGGGHAICYVDDRANGNQRAALTSLLRGELGGPWGIFNKTYELSDPAHARFEVQMSEQASRATVGSAVQLELEAIRNPVTQADVHPEVVMPEGLILKRAGMAASKVFNVGDALQLEHSGKYAAFGAFEYS